GTNGPRPTYPGNGGQGKSGPRGPPVGGNVTTQQTNVGAINNYRGGTWGGGPNPYTSLRYPTPMAPANATTYSTAYPHQPAKPDLTYRQLNAGEVINLSTGECDICTLHNT
ncbi:hypothetical protein L9F63_019717, partial [Diploptera punctata]